MGEYVNEHATSLKSPQNLFPGRSRCAESEFDDKNLKIWHRDVKIDEGSKSKNFHGGPDQSFGRSTVLGGDQTTVLGIRKP